MTGKKATQEGNEDLDYTNEKVRLKRRFGLLNSVAIIIGIIISTTIFISPTGVLEGTRSGGLALIVWVLCGVIATLGALIFAELGVTFPRSGGMYVYLEEYYGPGVSFVFFWFYFLMLRPAANAVKCLTAAIYLMQLGFLGCEPPSGAVALLAILMASLLVYVNMVNVKLSAGFQTIMLILVISSLVLVAGVGLFFIGSGRTTHLNNLFDNVNPDISDIALSFYPGLYSYGGWEVLAFVIEEVKRPIWTLPRAVCISMFMVTTLYVSVNVAYIAVLGEEGIMASEAIAATMLHKVIGSGFIIMPILTTFAGIGSFNSGTIIASRLGYVSARRGHLPAVLGLVQLKFLTPVTSLLLHLAIVVLFCAIGDVYFLLRNLSFAYSSFKALTVIGYIRHRYKYPDYKRPLKVPIAVAVLYLATQLFLLGVPLFTNPMKCVIGLAISIGTSLPYYIVFVLRPWNIDALDRVSAKVLRSTQKILNAAIPEKDPFLDE